MKIKIYSLTTDTDGGLVTSLFATESALDDAMWQFVATYYSDEVTIAELKEQHEDAFTAFQDRMDKGADLDSMTSDEHEVEFPNDLIRAMLNHNELDTMIKPSEILTMLEG